MRSRDAAVLATCLRALGMQQWPPLGPDQGWYGQPPEGSAVPDGMHVVDDLQALINEDREVAYRDDECRVQTLTYGTVDREIRFKIIGKYTVRVYRTMFDSPTTRRVNKTMTVDDMLFYVKWCMPVDRAGVLFADTSDAARAWLKRVRDWCVADGRLAFYVHPDAQKPLGFVHIGIRRIIDNSAYHLFMLVREIPLVIIRAEEGYDVGGPVIASYADDKAMLAFLEDTADSLCEAQPKAPRSDAWRIRQPPGPRDLNA